MAKNGAVGSAVAGSRENDPATEDTGVAVADTPGGRSILVLSVNPEYEVVLTSPQTDLINKMLPDGRIVKVDNVLVKAKTVKFHRCQAKVNEDELALLRLNDKWNAEMYTQADLKVMRADKSKRQVFDKIITNIMRRAANSRCDPELTMRELYELTDNRA